MSTIAAVDIFCGAGGLSYGLSRSGIKVVAGIDNDENCRFPYEYNVGPLFIKKDISKLTSTDILKLYPAHSCKILVGCAPCQPFSAHTNKAKKKDVRWSLLYEFGRIVKKMKPEIVSIENVVPIRNEKVFVDFLKLLQRKNYHYSIHSVFCPDYGIPQRRRRLVLLASSYDDIDLIPPTHLKMEYTTVRYAIGNLPPIRDGETCESDSLHKCWKMNKLNKKRILISKPGGTWNSWPKDVRAKCHQRSSGSTYRSVYSRMSWDEPAPTITTQFYNYGTGRFGHPKQNRALSLREGAILQTFPHDFLFADDDKKIVFKQIGQQIGNAVPILLGEVIGKSIIKHLEQVGVKK